jgi:hypothetical protein
MKQMADKVLPKKSPFEAEFAEADQAASPPEQKAVAAIPSETDQSSVITAEDSVRWAKIRWLARHEPREAILEAGLVVRNEAIAALKKHISIDDNLELATERTIGDLLIQHKIIDYGQFGILLQVLRVRDAALFKDDFKIKVEDAYIYVNMASKLFLVLRESCIVK